MWKYFAAISVASSVQQEEASEMAAKYLHNKKKICIYIHIYIYIYILQSLQHSLYNRSPTRLVHIFVAIWQGNEFNICVAKLFIYIPVINHTPTFTLNLFSCKKNVNKARGICCVARYNHCHNIVRSFDVLPSFLFITSETKPDYL